jgi:hypothetical protein
VFFFSAFHRIQTCTEIICITSFHVFCVSVTIQGQSPAVLGTENTLWVSSPLLKIARTICFCLLDMFIAKQLLDLSRALDSSVFTSI